MELFTLLKVPTVPHVFLYTKPINMSWRENKLTELCINSMGLDPKNGGVFLFYNNLKNKIKLFYFDDFGYQEVMKLLPKGGFILPVSLENQPYIKISSKKLPTLLRM